MRTLLAIALFSGITSAALASFCNTANDKGVLTVTTASQTTSTVSSGRPYWTFSGTAGCTYTFSTCGLTGVDTYLRLYTGTGTTLIAANDQGCGDQSIIVWTCNNTGTYSILISRFSSGFFSTNDCNTLNDDVRMSYIKDCTLNPQSCLGATQVCSDVAFTGNSGGGGGVELTTTTAGCLEGGEHQSSWYYFQPVTSGTVSMTITTGVDYDFAIWTGTCASLGSPVRCSWASTPGNTGMGNGASDNTEGQYGNKWVAPLPVTAGQTYVMMIDNYTANSAAFTLNWGMAGGASLNCTPIVLPVELVSFTAEYDGIHNSDRLSWKTESERLNDYFTLERSTDGMDEWVVIDKESGQENSTTPVDYAFDDYAFAAGAINYYRLSQTDDDGTTKVLSVIAVDNEKAQKNVIKVYNTLGQEVPAETSGIVILLYEDGTTRRVMQ